MPSRTQAVCFQVRIEIIAAVPTNQNPVYTGSLSCTIETPADLCGIERRFGMPLTICPDCGGPVSTSADACPQCGCPAKVFASKSAEKPSAKQPSSQSRSAIRIPSRTPSMTASNSSDQPLPQGKVQCGHCRAVVTPQNMQAGCSAVIIAILLLCIGIIPGVIYIIWQSNKKQCPNCKLPIP